MAEGTAVAETTPGDGTDRLCRALYAREPELTDYVGGSNARMLHDAADRLMAMSEVLSDRELTKHVQSSLRALASRTDLGVNDVFALGFAVGALDR